MGPDGSMASSSSAGCSVWESRWPANSGSRVCTWRVGGLSKYVISGVLGTLRGILIGIIILIRLSNN